MEDQARRSRDEASRTKNIGVTHRVTRPSSAWSGEVRLRFSDFQVNEIGPNGSVIHLHTQGLSQEQRQRLGADKSETEESDKQLQTTEAPPRNVSISEPPIEVSAEDAAALETAVGQAFAQELIQLSKSKRDDASAKKQAVSGPIEDKSQRAQIHQEVRRVFDSRIETTTNDDGTITGTLATPRRPKNRGKRGKQKGKGDEQPQGEYVHFTLYKDNRDTMDAVNQIARMLRVKPQMIGYAGTKDRRASTAQRCSIRYARFKNLAGINGKIWGIATGDYEYKDRPIHLGQLAGNEFTLTIKDCEMANEDKGMGLADRTEAFRVNVQAALDHMTEHGWINYFGHQRFGTHEIGTHEIGKLILCERYEEAVRALLSYDPETAQKAEAGELSEETAARDQQLRHYACMLFLTGKDPKKAAETIPRRFAAEVCVLRHLTRTGDSSMRDYVGAIIHITKGLRSMYLHAYQSLVWNHAASKRWEMYGTKVVKGDLVTLQAQAESLVGGQDQDGDDIINVVEDDEDAPVRARPLTEEEASSGSYTIHDVVLPSPGFDVIYPDNEIGAFYEEFMAREENGAMDPHKMRRMHREFSLPGRYRKIMNKFLATPSLEVKTYSDDTEQMHPTDLDIIKTARSNNRKRPATENSDDAEQQGPSKRAKENGHTDNADGAGSDNAEQQNESPPQQTAGEGGQPESQTSEPSKIAAIVKFQLGRSAYATMALRELMGDSSD